MQKAHVRQAEKQITDGDVLLRVNLPISFPCAFAEMNQAPQGWQAGASAGDESPQITFVVEYRCAFCLGVRSTSSSPDRTGVPVPGASGLQAQARVHWLKWRFVEIPGEPPLDKRNRSVQGRPLRCTARDALGRRGKQRHSLQTSSWRQSLEMRLSHRPAKTCVYAT